MLFLNYEREKTNPMAKGHIELQPKNLASIFRGLYVRVASRVGVDPSYVSRVARGERKSEEVEAILEQETRKIISQLSKKSGLKHQRSHARSANHNGSRRTTESRRGTGARLRASGN
jgi:ribosomal protein S19E (S16A)